MKMLGYLDFWSHGKLECQVEMLTRSRVSLYFSGLVWTEAVSSPERDAEMAEHTRLHSCHHEGTLRKYLLPDMRLQ